MLPNIETGVTASIGPATAAIAYAAECAADDLTRMDLPVASSAARVSKRPATVPPGESIESTMSSTAGSASAARSAETISW